MDKRGYGGYDPGYLSVSGHLFSICVCVCVCVCIYIYTHTHRYVFSFQKRFYMELCFACHVVNKLHFKYCIVTLVNCIV